MAKAKKSKSDAPTIDLSALYSDEIDEIARRQNAEASNLDVGPATSTGLLTLDLQIGGGIRAAMYVTSGGEQSCKTTTALTIMASSLKQEIPIIEWWDFEGSTKNSRSYIGSIMRGTGVKLSIDEIFGKKDDSTGKWLVRPKVRYHAETRGEKFFHYLHALLSNLPDKRYINKKWWLVFEDNKVNKAKYGEHSDSSMPKKYGKGIWIPAPDGKLQAVVFTDSLPAMNPEANDEEDEENKGLALQARMFSKHLPRVKGRLAEKMVALICVNQLRAVPMAMYGPKETEPGGNAPKFNSDCRIRNTSRASNQPLWPKTFDEDRFEVENSVEFEGQDRYRYIHGKSIKNKLWTPQRQTWYRLWHEDGAGQARGFDPFWDTMYYLRQTGQLQGKGRKGLSVDLSGMGKSKSIDWLDFKAWVLGNKETMIKVSKKAGYPKPFSIRNFCFKQIADGTGEKLYIEVQKAKKAKEED